MANARLRLNELCGKLHLQPKHEAQPCPEAAAADTPSSSPRPGGVKGTSWRASIAVLGLVFEGTGPNKKAAQEAAAEKAAAHLEQHLEQQQAAGTVRPSTNFDVPDVAEALALILKASHREPAFHCFFQQATEEERQELTGWVPLSLLLQGTKATRNWLTKHGPAQCRALGLHDPAGSDHVTQVLLLAALLKNTLQEKAQQAQAESKDAPAVPPAGDAGATAAPKPSADASAAPASAAAAPDAAAPNAAPHTGAQPMETDDTTTAPAATVPPASSSPPQPKLSVEQMGCAVRLVPVRPFDASHPSQVMHEVPTQSPPPPANPAAPVQSAPLTAAADATADAAATRDASPEHAHAGPSASPLIPAVLLLTPSANRPGPCTQLVHLQPRGHLITQVAHLLGSSVPDPPTTTTTTSAASMQAEQGSMGAAQGRLVSFDTTGCKWMRVSLQPPAANTTAPAADNTIPADGAPAAGDAPSVASLAPSEAGVGVSGGAPGGVATGTAGKVGGQVVAGPAATCMEQVEAPTMYGLVAPGASDLARRVLGHTADQQQEDEGGEGARPALNPLASWLAGHAVYGDVLLTLCRPRNRFAEGAGKRPVMRWAGLDQTDVALALGAITPAVRLATLRGAPFLAGQLPTTFTTHGAWNGISPRALLAQYCERQLGWQTPGGAPAAAPVYQRLSWQEVQGDASAGSASASTAPVPAAAVPPGAATAAAAVGTDADGDAMAVDAVPSASEHSKRPKQAKQQDGPAGGAAEEAVEEELGGDWEAGEARLPVGAVVLELSTAALGGKPAVDGMLRAEEEVSQDHPSVWEAAENRAALKVLRALHDLDATAARHLLLGATTDPSAPTLPSTLPGGMQQEEESGVGAGEGNGIEVLHEGDLQHRNVRPGTMPVIDYQLWLHLPAGTSAAASLRGSPASGVSGGSCKRLREETVEPGEARKQGAGVAAVEGMETDAEGREEVGEGGDAGGGKGAARKAQEAVPLVLVEACKRLPFQVGCGSVAALVEKAVCKLHVRGCAKCRLKMPAAGPDPFGVLPRVRGSLLVTLASVHTPALAPGGAGLPHFEKPLNSLRTQQLLRLCESRGVSRLLDLGCGSAAILMAISPGWAARLSRYVGLDVSKHALCSAGKKLARRLGGTVDPPPPAAAIEGPVSSDAGVDGTPLVFRCDASAAAGVPACELRACNVFQPSLANEPVAWGDLVGIDAAIMSEVVEHLDPEPLSKVGACLLGGLVPKVLIVTTPNWEYNAVMRMSDTRTREELGMGASPMWPGPPGRDGKPLRCSDHRFEWTRQEFEAWAKGVAEEHGYTVEFQGVGKVTCTHPEVQQASEAAGFAVQVAIFEVAHP